MTFTTDMLRSMKKHAKIEKLIRDNYNALRKLDDFRLEKIIELIIALMSMTFDNIFNRANNLEGKTLSKSANYNYVNDMLKTYRLLIKYCLAYVAAVSDDVWNDIMYNSTEGINCFPMFVGDNNYRVSFQNFRLLDKFMNELDRYLDRDFLRPIEAFIKESRIPKSKQKIERIQLSTINSYEYTKKKVISDVINSYDPTANFNISVTDVQLVMNDIYTLMESIPRHRIDPETKDRYINNAKVIAKGVGRVGTTAMSVLGVIKMIKR